MSGAGTRRPTIPRSGVWYWAPDWRAWSPLFVGDLGAWGVASQRRAAVAAGFVVRVAPDRPPVDPPTDAELAAAERVPGGFVARVRHGCTGD